MGKGPAITRRRLLALLAVSAGGRLTQAQKQNSSGGKMTQAETVINEYRYGGEFHPQTPGFFSGGSLSTPELNVLISALPKESSRVREQIVRLLVDLGRRADPLFGEGAAILREPAIIAALTGPALVSDDAARDNALTLLHEFVPAAELAMHSPALTADFQRFPSSSSFLVLAKAKPPRAKPSVRKIAATPRWENETSALIALAALGDQATERHFTDPFASTEDPREFARLAQYIGWIGTPTALRALADQVRTSLIFEIPNAVRRSSRVDVVAALSFNFPEEPALFPNRITSEHSYDAVENFCRNHFGSQWSKPRPPFLVSKQLPF